MRILYSFSIIGITVLDIQASDYYTINIIILFILCKSIQHFDFRTRTIERSASISFKPTYRPPFDPRNRQLHL